MRRAAIDAFRVIVSFETTLLSCEIYAKWQRNYVACSTVWPYIYTAKVSQVRRKVCRSLRVSRKRMIIYEIYISRNYLYIYIYISIYQSLYPLHYIVRVNNAIAYTHLIVQQRTRGNFRLPSGESKFINLTQLLQLGIHSPKSREERREDKTRACNELIIAWMSLEIGWIEAK